MTLIASPSEMPQKVSPIEVSISLARGGALALDYSNDGAKDLASATWPAMASGPFTIPGIVHGFGYNRS